MKNLLILAVVVLLAVAGWFFRAEISSSLHAILGHHGEHGGAQDTVEYWTCPMHPSVRSDEPGACPMCGMDLTPVQRDDPADHAEHEAAVEYWTCPMHPSVRSDEPGSCPMCGMDLTPVQRDDPADHAEHEAAVEHWTCPMHPAVRSDEPGSCPICGMDLTPVHRETAAPTPGRTDFVVDTYRRQLINVQSTPVEERLMEKEIRTVGILELDETRITDVYPRVSGWIQEVYANFVHQPVEKGRPLFSVYSPELVASQEEYLLALRTVEELSGSPFEHVSRGAGSLLEAARRRLELFEVSAARIRDLEKSGEVDATLIIPSPVTGYVTERNAFPNRRVTPESKIYTIADYSHIWAWVRVYEHEIGQIREGQPAVVRTAAYPGEAFRGRVTFIAPDLDGGTRTLRARLEFANPNFRLKPEMYVDVELKISLGRFLAVPDSAVLRGGQRDQVFVDRGEGRMELRPVSVGEKAGGYYRVLSGLQAGERVVTQANFLIDSESKIRGIGADWDTPQPTHVH